MKVAIIGAGMDAVQSMEHAKQLNIVTLALDDRPDAPGSAVADAFHLVDFTKKEDMIELLRREKVDFLMPFVDGEKALVAGAINDALHLPGYSEKAAELCTDRYLFHKQLRGKGLRMHHCFLLTRDYLFDPFEITYPAIVKPRYAENDTEEVFYMSCPGDLVEFQVKRFDLLPKEEPKEEKKGFRPIVTPKSETVQNTPGWNATVAAKKQQNERIKEELLRLNKELMELDKKQEKEKLAGLEWLVQKKLELADKNREEKSFDSDAEYVLEEVFDGREYAIDAAMEGCNMEIVMIWEKLMTAPPAMQAVGYLTVLPEEDRVLYDRMKKYLDRVVETIGLRDCMFRADVRVKGKDLFAIHISLRPAPSRIHDEMLPYSTGIHIGREYLCYMSGRRHNFQPLQVKNSMLHYFDMENCFVHDVPTEKDLTIPVGIQLKQWKCSIKTLDYLEHVTTGESLTKRGYYILEGEKDSRLLQFVDTVNRMFKTS